MPGADTGAFPLLLAASSGSAAGEAPGRGGGSAAVAGDGAAIGTPAAGGTTILADVADAADERLSAKCWL